MRMCVSILIAVWLCIVFVPTTYNFLLDFSSFGTDIASYDRVDVRCTDFDVNCPIGCARCTKGEAMDVVWQIVVQAGLGVAVATGLVVGLARLRWPSDE